MHDSWLFPGSTKTKTKYKYSLLGNMVETSGNRLYKSDYIKVKFLGYDNVV